MSKTHTTPTEPNPYFERSAFSGLWVSIADYSGQEDPDAQGTWVMVHPNRAEAVAATWDDIGAVLSAWDDDDPDRMRLDPEAEMHLQADDPGGPFSRWQTDDGSVIWSVQPLREGVAYGTHR